MNEHLEELILSDSIYDCFVHDTSSLDLFSKYLCENDIYEDKIIDLISIFYESVSDLYKKYNKYVADKQARKTEARKQLFAPARWVNDKARISKAASWLDAKTGATTKVRDLKTKIGNSRFNDIVKKTIDKVKDNQIVKSARKKVLGARLYLANRRLKSVTMKEKKSLKKALKANKENYGDLTKKSYEEKWFPLVDKKKKLQEKRKNLKTKYNSI